MSRCLIVVACVLGLVGCDAEPALPSATVAASPPSRVPPDAGGTPDAAGTLDEAVASTVGPDEERPADSAARASARLRIVAANLTSGPRQAYDPGHGTRILQTLDPDVILIQEFNVGGNTLPEVTHWVQTSFGTEFSYYRERGAQIPNGVISRWPILAAGTWEDTLCPNREFVWARIDVPGPVDLWVISLHLLTRSAPTRDGEGRQLLQYVREHVPDADYLVIGGDLNTKSATEQVLTTLEEFVSRAHVPTGPDGKPGTNASRRRPYDHLLPDGDLEAHHVAVDFGGRRYEHGLVFDSRAFESLEGLGPVRAGDSGADQMQHMAVVKDFLLPAGD